MFRGHWVLFDCSNAEWTRSPIHESSFFHKNGDLHGHLEYSLANHENLATYPPPHALCVRGLHSCLASLSAMKQLRPSRGRRLGEASKKRSFEVSQVLLPVPSSSSSMPDMNLSGQSCCFSRQGEGRLGMASSGILQVLLNYRCNYGGKGKRVGPRVRDIWLLHESQQNVHPKAYLAKSLHSHLMARSSGG